MILFARLGFRWLSVVVALALGGGVGMAQNSPQVLEPQQILKELDQIQRTRSGQFKSGLRQQIDELSAAAASKQSAVNLYEKAVQAVEFEGKPKDGAEFSGWREKYKEMLNDDDFRSGLQLHLRYLVLSLKRLDGMTNEEIMPDLMEYTNHLSALLSDLIKREKPNNDVQERNEKNRPKDKQAGNVNRAVLNKGREVLNRPLSDTIFVRWYRLEGHVGSLKDWEMSSGNIEGMMDKVIMPYMRGKKDARLFALWDERIVRAEEVAKKSDLAIDLDKYQNQTLPTLLWKKAQDRILLGQKGLGCTEMLEVIRTYQSHPDFEKWVKELSGLVKGDGATETAAAPAN